MIQLSKFATFNVTTFETITLAAYAVPFEKSRPLVSVCVATYNRPEPLVDRCLKSILARTYDNLDIVVVGDGCEVETDKAIASVRGDTRLRYVNLAREKLGWEPTVSLEDGLKETIACFRSIMG